MLVSKTKFAAMKGWDKSTVTHYAKEGKIVVTEPGRKGLVDVEASEALLAATKDPLKEGVRQRHERERRRALLAEAVQTSASATPSDDLEEDELEHAMREHGPLQIAFLAWPTLLKRAGVTDAQLDYVQPAILEVFRRELIAGGATPAQAEEARALFAEMLANERAAPETESELPPIPSGRAAT